MRNGTSKSAYALLWLLRVVLLTCLALLFLTIFVGCGVRQPDVKPTFVCLVPENLLEATSVPPMNDETVYQIIMEATELRNALHQANLDKAQIAYFIDQHCKPKDDKGG
jgi:hypothetical protein